MIKTVAKIVEDVRVCMDENRKDDVLFADGDIDTLKFDEVIRSKILEAVDRVHALAPYWLLEQGHNFNVPEQDDDLEEVGHGCTVHWEEMESGWVDLPEDYHRLVVFAMSDWERPVYEVLRADSARYRRCRSSVKALRGTYQRPVCAIGVRPEGRVLEFYSCRTRNATVSRAVYIPKAREDEYGGVDISERCYRAVVYTIAGLVKESEGDVNRAEMYYNKAKQLLEE